MVSITRRDTEERIASRDAGFTLVELMVVVLIIGILVTIAVPVFTRARLDAESKACQANQRTIAGAIDLARTGGVDLSAASSGQLALGGSGWHGVLVPGWIRSTPTCPVNGDSYYLSVTGEMTGDNGAVFGFKPGHALP